MEIKVCLSVLYIENIAQDHIPVLWESVHRCFGYQDCPVFLPDLGTAALSPIFKGRNRKGERACNHFFYDPLPPTFGVFEIKRISALKHLTCHWVGIFFKFLTWLFRTGLIPSECKKGVGRQHVRTLSILVDLTISEPRTGWFLACSCVLIFSVIDHNTISIPETLPGGGGPMSPVWILKHLVLVFINACCLLSALPSLLQFGQGRFSLVTISFYVVSLLFGPCCLSEFTLAGPHSWNILAVHGFWSYSNNHH